MLAVAFVSLRSVFPTLLPPIPSEGLFHVFTRIHRTAHAPTVYIETLGEYAFVLSVPCGRSGEERVLTENVVVHFRVEVHADYLPHYVLARPVHVVRVLHEVRCCVHLTYLLVRFCFTCKWLRAYCNRLLLFAHSFALFRILFRPLSYCAIRYAPLNAAEIFGKILTQLCVQFTDVIGRSFIIRRIIELRHTVNI